MPHELFVAVSGTDAIHRFADSVRVGRAETNGLVLSHDLVSAEHLELQRTGERWEVVDLGSTNGTYIDGVPITRATLGAATTVRLGHDGPVLRLTIPEAAVAKGGTREQRRKDIVERYFAAEAPADMSPHTRTMRAAVQERRASEAEGWRHRLRRLRVAVGVLAVVAVGAGGVAAWQARRVNALKATAGEVFNTMKALDLDLRRLQAAAGPDSTTALRRARLEAQYQDLLKTLGIYSSGTPEDIQLIYRTIHRLGESEATVPRGFVDEVKRYVRRWHPADLEAGLARARNPSLAPVMTEILRQHHLPPEFLYLALQESKFDPGAIGPSTRLGVPKGLWQLIPPTAEAYGLRLGPLQGERVFDPSDERHDVVKATTAAARYLADIYTTDAQASGLLVMASYNMGETRLRRLLRSLPENPAARNFWALLEKHRDQVPAETYDYVFRVVSAAVVGANPRLFGFTFAPVISAGDAPTAPVAGPTSAPAPGG